MLSAVVANRTTSDTVRTELAEKCELMTVLVPVPVVGAVPLMLRRTMDPWVSRPTLFWVAVGWQGGGPVHVALVHFAEWNFSAMNLPIEYGKMVFAPLSTGLMPSFSSAVLCVHGPPSVSPVEVRKNALVPDLVCRG